MRRLTFLYLILLFSLLAPSLAQAQSVPEDEPVPMEQNDVAQNDVVQSDAVYDEAARGGRLQFAPCPENAALECGTLNVPVDYRQPQGEKVGLAVIRAKALDPSQRIGVLFAHTGGHESGVDFVLGAHPAPAFVRLRQRFDVVSLDPRGAGRSRPFLCNFDLPDLPADQSDAVMIAYLDDYARRIAEQCLDEDRAFRLSITGNNFARDIEVLRRALGERQLSFGMISNSGPVAGIYATFFPKQIRAMVIDSPVAPEFHDYWIERPTEQSASYETALHRIDQLCRRDPACRLHDTGVVAAFETLATALRAAPVTSPSGVPFTEEDLSEAFFQLLPVERFWPVVVAALADALAGDYAIFFQLQTSGNTPRASDAIIARLCNDYGTRSTAADYFPLTEALDAIYPHFFPRFAIALQTAWCAQWPAADPPIIRHVQRRVERPILLIGSTFDSDAPFPWTKRLAQALGMERYVVRYQGGGHGLAQRHELTCMANVIDAYLFNLQLPAEGTRCAALPIPFDSAATQASLEAKLNQPTYKSYLPLIEQ